MVEQLKLTTTMFSICHELITTGTAHLMNWECYPNTWYLWYMENDAYRKRNSRETDMNNRYT